MVLDLAAAVVIAEAGGVVDETGEGTAELADDRADDGGADDAAADEGF